MSLMFSKIAQSLTDPPLGRSSNGGLDAVRLSFLARHAATGTLRHVYIEHGVVNPSRMAERPIVDRVRADGTALAPCHAWVRAGLWGEEPREAVVHAPVAAIRRDPKGVVDFGPAQFSESRFTGAIAPSEASALARNCPGRFDWDLRIEAADAGGGRVDPVWAVAVSGYFTSDGEHYLVEPETALGIVERRTGRGCPAPLFRLATRNLSDGTGRGGGWLSVGPTSARDRLVVRLVHAGQDYAFGGASFWPKGMVSMAATDDGDAIGWKLVGKSQTALIELDVRCRKIEMLRCRPQQPDGSYRHETLWTGGTGAGEMRLYRRDGETLDPIDTITLKDVLCEYGAPAPRF
jgi:tocopherol cyclase